MESYAHVLFGLASFIPLRLIHLVAYSNSVTLLVLKSILLNSIMWICHNLLIYSLVDEYLGYFQSLLQRNLV